MICIKYTAKPCDTMYKTVTTVLWHVLYIYLHMKYKYMQNAFIQYIFCYYIYIYLIFIILGFHNCNFVYLPKFVCNPKINPCSTLAVSFIDIWKAGKILCCPVPSFSAEVEQGNILPSCFSSPAVNKCPFHGLFSAPFLTVACFQLLVLHEPQVQCWSAV